MGTASMIRPYQARALQELSGDGFRVGGTRGVCSERCYDQLRAAGYLEEHWTWASTTRPDCGISDAGRAALAEYIAAHGPVKLRRYVARRPAMRFEYTAAHRM